MPVVKTIPVSCQRSLASVLSLSSAYFVLALFGPSWLTLANFWPSLLLYLVAVELVNFPHHIDMPVVADPDTKLAPWEQHQTTRSCNYGALSSFLVLNFNFHIEHHLYPTLPWYRLAAVRDRVKALLPDDYTEVTGIGWNLKNRARDPQAIMLRDQRLPSAPVERKRDAA